MNNENIEKKVDEEEVDYIAALEDLRANTVPLEKYNKVKDDNRRLLNSLARGEAISQDKIIPKESDADLRKALYGNGCEGISNLDYWKKTLELRNRIIESGREDPFVPQGHNVVATDQDRAAAQKVAEVVQRCIDVADGDSLVFTNELQRCTADVNLMRARR